ncbi:MAG: hypothetical protein HQ558_03780 [Candidatus Omnitrophica bacterium]|nr:hypothetical protein [Candidatus Omnitrophota bacterium]
MKPLSMRFQKTANLKSKKKASSIKGQTVVEFVLILSVFVLAMMAITAGLSRGFGVATKKYLYMYDFNPTKDGSSKRFSY